MTYHGEITALKHMGDGVEVTVSNLKRRAASRYDSYEDAVVLRVPIGSSRTFYMGRRLSLILAPR